jgi:hypothetical protein
MTIDNLGPQKGQRRPSSAPLDTHRLVDLFRSIDIHIKELCALLRDLLADCKSHVPGLQS